MHIDAQVEQAEVAAGVVPHIDAAADLVGVWQDKGHVAMLIGDQDAEGDVLAGLLGADNGATRKRRADFQGESGGGPDRDEICLQRDIRLLFVPATAFAGKSESNDSNQGSAD